MKWSCTDVSGQRAPELRAALESWPRQELLVETPTVRVERRLAPDGESYAVKRYAFPRLVRRLEAAFRHTWLAVPKARAEMRALAQLRALGVPVVEPVGCGVRRDRAGFVRDSFLITRWWPHLDLDRLLSTAGPPSPEAWRALGLSIAVMHVRGVRHGGLAARNVLVGREESGAWRVRWLDPARARFRGRPLTRAEAERDLDELRPTLDAAPEEARAAFEEGYCSPSFWSPATKAGSTSSESPTTP